MKVLVYGAGVIGSYLAHILCRAGNDVTVLARGVWKEQLEKNGLRIRHHLQRKATLDRPAVIGDISEDNTYDAVFAVMPYHRIGAILESLSALHSPLVILVGNNVRPGEMERTILEKTVCEKQVLFGFQATAGKREKENGVLICERLGSGTMDLGRVHGEADAETRARMKTIFDNTGYRLNWQPDMEAYLICHLAAILPISYLAYACNGDLRFSSGAQRKSMRLASREAYAALKRQGIPVLPKGEDRFYAPGVRGALMQVLYFVMAKNKTIGDLVACEHCRNAYEEMELLDRAFCEIISRRPEEPMTRWMDLRGQMPGWDAIHALYGREKQP